MKKLLLSAMLLIGLSAQAQRLPPRYKTPKQSKLDKEIWNVTDNTTQLLRYTNPVEAAAKIDKEATLKLWTPEQTAKEKQALPPGGWFSQRAAG